MLVKLHVESTIKNVTEEAIWEFAYNPVNWTVSNPIEHKGLVFGNKQNRPETGVTFYQKESVAGIYADLRGQVLYAQRPKVCAWAGVAAYKFYGFTIHIPEGGTVKLTDTKNGIIMSHDAYMDFPDTVFGKVAVWYFKKVRNGENAMHIHAQREVDFFKKQLEGGEKS